MNSVTEYQNLTVGVFCKKIGNMADDIRNDSHRCIVCSKQFKCKSHVRKHMKDKHHTNGPTKTSFNCSVCEETFTQLNALELHERKEHGHICYPHRCKNCDEWFSDKKVLKEHMARVHFSEGASKTAGDLQKLLDGHLDERPYECGECSVSFKYNSRLKEHMQCHRDERPYQCEWCNSSFKQRRHLNRHVMVHQSIKPYSCKICFANFTREDYLQQHLRLHTGERPYKCDICTAAFKSQQNLRRHKIIHNDDRPYKCEVCFAPFKSRPTLKSHMHLHCTKRSYECVVCAATFKQKKDLNRHLKSHKMERPFLCTECPAAFLRKSNLTRHSCSVHTNERPSAGTKGAHTTKANPMKKIPAQMQQVTMPPIISKRVTTFFPLNLPKYELLKISSFSITLQDGDALPIVGHFVGFPLSTSLRQRFLSNELVNKLSETDTDLCVTRAEREFNCIA